MRYEVPYPTSGWRYVAAKLVAFSTSLVVNAAGIAIAAAALDGVSATATGVVLAALVLSAPVTFNGVFWTHRRARAKADEERLATIMAMSRFHWLLTLFLPVAASVIVPGFAIHNLWGYAAVLIITFVTSLPMFLVFRTAWWHRLDGWFRTPPGQSDPHVDRG